MANATGTYYGATDLLQKLNTFVTANSWTKLHGETDIVPASPKSARYWRLLVLDPENAGADYREIRKLEWRTTSGGANVATTEANYSFSNLNGVSDLVTGTAPTISADIDDNWWWVQYDFGSNTIIREIVMTADTDDYAPSNFLIQWSHDARTWMTMYAVENQAWVDGQVETYTFDTAYTDPYHYSSTIGRRGGWLIFQDEGSTRGLDSEGCSNYWSWQGPGYDADRRVNVHAVTFSDQVSGTDKIVFDASVATNVIGDVTTYLPDQEGSRAAIVDFSTGATPTLLLSSGSGTYWFYLSSSRVFIVVKSGVDDYSSAYVGFMSSFATPDDYPFPLYVGGTCSSRTGTLSDTAASFRDAVDPGSNAAFYRSWDNSWVQVANHFTLAGSVNDPRDIPEAWTWPFHGGHSGRGVWPDNTVGDYVDYDSHFLDRIEATTQGDLPLFPVIIMDRTYGNVGALDGIFCIPQGGVVSPEQVITISAVNYRVFRVRDKSGGMVYWAVRED